MITDLLCDCRCYTPSNEKYYRCEQNDHHNHTQNRIDDGETTSLLHYSTDRTAHGLILPTPDALLCPSYCYEDNHVDRDDDIDRTNYWNPWNCLATCYESFQSFLYRFHQFMADRGRDRSSQSMLDPPRIDNDDGTNIFDLRGSIDDDDVASDNGCDARCYRENIHRDWELGLGCAIVPFVGL